MHNHSHADHQHGHGHSHGHGAARHVLLIAVVFTLGFALVEALAGWVSGSLVLLSDAGHMLSDSLALGIAAFAAWIANRPPSDQHTYGYGRAEVIAAWISSIFLIVVIIGIVIEAIRRFQHPEHVQGEIVMVVATIGLMVNVAIAWLLSRGERTINVRAAILHVMGDVLGSIAALISGAVIYFTHWEYIDPILSIFISVLILISSLRILRESIVILMEGVPMHIELAAVGAAMVEIKDVNSIHDLHIWTLSSGVVALSAHVDIDSTERWPQMLASLKTLLAERFGIKHITLQPEMQTQVIQRMEFVGRELK